MGELFSKKAFLGEKLRENLWGDCSTWETNYQIMQRGGVSEMHFPVIGIL